MDRGQYVQKRRKKYLAQLLEAFEADIEPHLPTDLNGVVQDFKGKVRAKMNALAKDASDIFSLEDVALNGVAQDIKDRIGTS